MKRVAAIILSLMLLWLQATAAAPMTFLPAKAVCACCDCKQMNCCVTPAPPATQPLPATVMPTVTQNPLSVFAATLEMWTLPASELAHVSAFASAPLLAPGLPLFTRHCARLI